MKNKTPKKYNNPIKRGVYLGKINTSKKLSTTDKIAIISGILAGFVAVLLAAYMQG